MFSKSRKQDKRLILQSNKLKNEETHMEKKNIAMLLIKHRVDNQKKKKHTHILKTRVTICVAGQRTLRCI